jgi:hypothetical protein
MFDEFFGDDVVAIVWSFTDRTDIPYRITRTGKSAKNGGTGYKWRCTCPTSQNRGYNCKHIRTMRALCKNGTIDDDEHYRLSPFGRSILSIGERSSVSVPAAAPPINPVARALFADMMNRIQQRV